MPNLKLSKFCMPEHFDDLGIVSKVNLPQSLEYLSDELRYFYWHKYHLKILPSNFIQENLITLNLPHNKLEKILEGKKVHL